MGDGFEVPGVTVKVGDCIDVMRSMPDGSVDAIVTDPPYGLGFMGKDWDSIKAEQSRPPSADTGLQKYPRTGKGPAAVTFDGHSFQDWCRQWAGEALRVCKPGAHMVAFGGTRTWHRLACGIEDAGWEIRDTLAWLYSMGFPKSLDVSKAIDRTRHRPDAIGVVREWITARRDAAGITNGDIDRAFGFNGMAGHWTTHPTQASVPTLDQVPKLLQLLGVASEDVPEAVRSALIDGNGMRGDPGVDWYDREVVGSMSVPGGYAFAGPTFGGDSRSRETPVTRAATDESARWEGYGTALKPAHESIVLARKPLDGTVAGNVTTHGVGALNIDGCRIGYAGGTVGAGPGPQGDVYGDGLNGAYGTPVDGLGRWPANVVLDEDAADMLNEQTGTLVSGKMMPTESDGRRNVYRDAGSFTTMETYGDRGGASRFFYVAKAGRSERPQGDELHPTVKPLDLMRWLVRLITPPGAHVLDPFAGTGTTGEAVIVEGGGRTCTLIERHLPYVGLIRARLDKPIQPTLGGLA